MPQQAFIFVCRQGEVLKLEPQCGLLSEQRTIHNALKQAPIESQDLWIKE